MNRARFALSIVAILYSICAWSVVAAAPAIPVDSPEYSRALKGRVVGPDGTPIRGAEVKCRHVRTPGEGLIDATANASVVTDDKGQFVLYPIDTAADRGGFRFLDLNAEPKIRERGELIPLNSKFSIDVEVPGDPSYFPFHGDPANTDFVIVRLQHPERDRTFKYEAPGGVFLGKDKLESLSLHYIRDSRSERFSLPPRYRTGGKLAPGTYTAQLDRIEFQPVVVTADGPAELIFRLPPPVTYAGRVVDGATGRPLARAFVIGMNGTGQYALSRLNADQWKQLETLPGNLRKDDPALTPVREMYTFDLVTRTDADGRFELLQPPAMGQTYGLVFFAQDRLPLLHRLYDAKVGPDGRATIADVPLFPAARVTVRPIWKPEREGLPSSPPSVMPVWEPNTDLKVQPPWFAAFRAAANGGQRQFAHDAYLQANQKQPIYVPAGVTLTLRLESPYHDQSSPRDIADVLKLDPGQEKDLGDVEFEPNLKTRIRVTDETGRLLEGVPVRWIDERHGVWTVVHNTDAKGEAEFFVRPHAIGRFGVIDLPGMNQGNLPGNLVIPFRAGDKAPDQPLPMRMTGQQVEVLRGPRPGAL